MSVAVKHQFKNYPYFTSPYHWKDGNYLRPKAPEFCPKNPTREQSCRIAFKGLRHRKCGPSFPITIFECTNHSISFTVYPPGWHPYGRMPIVNLAADGSVFSKSENFSNPLAGTVFSAAIDAANVKRWLDEARLDAGAKGVFKTQKRYIKGISILLGIAPESVEKHREQVTARLGIALSELRRVHARIRDGPALSWREKGLEIQTLIFKLQPISRHLASIQILGYAVEFWGQPINCH